MAGVDVVNRALLKLGDPTQLTALTESSKLANLFNAHYDQIRKAELRKYVWSFSVQQSEIAKDASYTAPDNSDAPSYRYALPTGFIRLADQEPDPFRDWRIWGQHIYTNDGSPLYVRWCKDVQDTDQWDELFLDTVACRLAKEFSPYRTSSRTNTADLDVMYKDTISEAKRIQAIEKPPVETPEDKWVYVRRG